MLMVKELHPYFIGIREHYLTEQKLLLFNDKSYCLVSNLSCINNTGGGVYIYVRSDCSKKISQFFERENL